MAAATSMGSSVTRPGVRAASVCAFLAVCLLHGSAAQASDRYALVVTGASGGPQYAKKYDAWRESFVNTLTHVFQYPDDHIVVLSEGAAAGRRATRENVRDALAGFRARATNDDVVLVLLIGHGSGDDSDVAKFNLVGPDLTATEWADLIRPIPGRVVFIDAASGSFPFLEKITGRNRVVLTANDSAQQQFETIFPEFFVKAFEGNDADFDKNGRVSIWEAFEYVSSNVRRWFEGRGQLATERPLLDDSGDGIGREVDALEAADGLVARVTYLQPDAPIADTGDSELTGLLRRRAALESELELLRVRKGSMPPDDYDTALERILLEMAQIDRRVRAKS
jgi:hypothetical protein